MEPIVQKATSKTKIHDLDRILAETDNNVVATVVHFRNTKRVF